MSNDRMTPCWYCTGKYDIGFLTLSHTLWGKQLFCPDCHWMVHGPQLRKTMEPHDIVAKSAGSQVREGMQEWLDDNPAQMYWNYDDRITTDQIDLLLEGKSWEAIEETEEWIRHDDGVQTNEDAQVKECLGAFIDRLLDRANTNNNGPDIEEDDIDIDELIDALELYGRTDIDFDTLVQQTSVRLTLDLEVEIPYKPHDYDEYEEILDFFNINPRTLYTIINGPSFDWPDEEPWPNKPERDNNEYVKPAEVFESMNNFFYSGMYVALLGGYTDLLTLSYALEEAEEDGKSLQITIPRGAMIIEHDYMNGAGGLGFRLIKDMTITLVKDNQLARDGRYSYGVDAVHGFVEEVWDQEFKFKVVKESNEAMGQRPVCTNGMLSSYEGDAV